MNQKQTIVITGTSSGIGRATAELFSKRGWHVAATMRKPEDHQELSHLKGVSLYQLDVTNETSIREAFKQIVSDHGKMNVLLNNAGYGAVEIFEEASPEQIQRQFDTNVFGGHECDSGSTPILPQTAERTDCDRFLRRWTDHIPNSQLVSQFKMGD